MKWIAVAIGAVVVGVAAAIIFVSMVRPEKMTAANEGNARAPSSVQGTNSADKGAQRTSHPRPRRRSREQPSVRCGDQVVRRAPTHTVIR